MSAPKNTEDKAGLGIVVYIPVVMGIIWLVSLYLGNQM